MRRPHKGLCQVRELGGSPGQCSCGPCLARANKRAVRAWRRLANLDLTKPPAPVIRWALLLILGLCCWAAGIPLVVQDWLGPIIIAGALILPDAAGFGIAGVRLDLKHAKDDLAAMRQEVNAQARASSAAGIAIGNDAITASTEAMIRAAVQAVSGQATGTARSGHPAAALARYNLATSRGRT
jgi:hypothetical protein